MSTNQTIRLYRKDEKRWHCGAKHCLSNATHVCTYDFTTKRSERATTTYKHYCREHAQKFLKKHNARYVRNEPTEDKDDE